MDREMLLQELASEIETVAREYCVTITDPEGAIEEKRRLLVNE